MKVLIFGGSNPARYTAVMSLAVCMNIVPGAMCRSQSSSWLKSFCGNRG